MSLFTDLTRAVKAGRRAVQQVQATVQAVERGAADVQALARGVEGAAEQLKAAGAQVRGVLATAEGALERAAPPVAAKVTSRARTPASKPGSREPEVVDAEVIDFGVGTSRRT